MFILEEPYVSDFLARTAAESCEAVLDTPIARRALGRVDPNARVAPSDLFIHEATAVHGQRIYSNSENAIDWIVGHLGFTDLPRQIGLFKDKVRFRELVAPLYPGYGFREVAFADLEAFDPGSLRSPFVVKPAVGFFSLGVHVVHDPAEWPSIVREIQAEVRRFEAMYPATVVGADRFIVEEAIPGDEYAVDAYFDSVGRPVIVNILKHPFASAGDVGDRLYYTSAAIVRFGLEPFTAFLARVAELGDLRDFPVHVELRVTPDGGIAPIEVNPMRFAGWCVADIAHHAWGLNPYLCYLEDRAPDWDTILAERPDRVTAVVIAAVPEAMDRSAIESVDYDAFAASFAKPLELRQVDWGRFPAFAFMFAELTGDEQAAVDEILRADFTPYLRTA